MRKLLVAIALTLGVVTAGEAATMAPASADSTCHVASPQINNSVVCAKATLSYNVGGYPYYIASQIQVKSVGYVAELQVRNGQTGAWFTCSPQVNYYPSNPGVVYPWCGSNWRPTRARLVVTNIYTGAVTTYSWNPFPLV